MIRFKKLEIDFDHLEKLDELIVVPGNPTPEETRAFSDFLKKDREKKTQAKAKRLLRSRTVSGIRK